MRQIVVFLITAVLTFMVNQRSIAQFFNTSPDGIVSITIQDNQEVSREFFFDNVTDTSLWLGWEIIDNSIPKDWGYSLCDNRICYNTVPSSAYMEPIIPEDFSFLRLALWNTSAGEGRLKIRVFDSNQLQHDTIEFRLSHPNANSNLSNSSTILYPNPVLNNSEVTIEFGSSKFSQLIIRDFLGKEVKRLSIHIGEKKKTLTVDELVQGIYFIQFLDKNNNTILTKRLVIS